LGTNDSTYFSNTVFTADKHFWFVMFVSLLLKELFQEPVQYLLFFMASSCDLFIVGALQFWM
jgi:hypothetical protein